MRPNRSLIILKGSRSFVACDIDETGKCARRVIACEGVGSLIGDRGKRPGIQAGQVKQDGLGLKLLQVPKLTNQVSRSKNHARTHAEHLPWQAVRPAVMVAEMPNRISCHALRHLVATHLLEANNDFRTVQGLPGHAAVSATMISTHVPNRPGLWVKSPADF